MWVRHCVASHAAYLKVVPFTMVWIRLHSYAPSHENDVGKVFQGRRLSTLRLSYAEHA
jgi:hypothetical protein